MKSDILNVILVQNMLFYEDLVNNEMSARTYLNKFSAPERSISSLLISMFSFDRFDWSFPRHVAARGSEP